MRDKYKAGVNLYRKSLSDLPSAAVAAINAILLKYGFSLFKKSRATGVSQYFHRQQNVVACFDPRGGPRNLGCGMPCIRIFKRLRADAEFDESRKQQEMGAFLLMDNIHLLYVNEDSIANIAEDARAFFAEFNKRIVGG